MSIRLNLEIRLMFGRFLAEQLHQVLALPASQLHGRVQDLKLFQLPIWMQMAVHPLHLPHRM
jgi:hypothetical protein